MTSDKILKTIRITQDESKNWDSKLIHNFLLNPIQLQEQYELIIKQRDIIDCLYAFIRRIAINMEILRGQNHRGRWNNLIDTSDKILFEANNFELEFPLIEFKIPDAIKNDPAYANIPAAHTNRIEGNFYFEALNYKPPLSANLEDNIAALKTGTKLESVRDPVLDKRVQNGSSKKVLRMD